MFFFKEYYDDTGSFCFDKYTKRCRFKGSTTVTNTSTYTPTEEEIRLQKQAADYGAAVAPNAYRLNDTAAQLLWDSLGSTQVDFARLNSAAQNQINAANSGMNGLLSSNTNATNTANSAINSIAPQYTTAANTANNALGSISNQYTTAGNTVNNALSSLSPQYSNAASSANSTLGGIGNQYTTAANSANSTLGSLANGVLPTAYQQSMENSINRALNNTMGQSLNSLAQRGVLNSSVTNRSMNDISANAADAVAQQYQNNINTVAGLTGQQLSNTNAALGARGEIAQQQLGNTNTALGAMGDLAQQQFGNTGTVLDARGNLAQQQLGNTNEALGTRASMAQQALANSMQNNASNADIYGNLLNSAAMGITTGAAAQEAAQQPALNLWNASLGLNQGGNGAALAAASGKGTTTGTQVTNTGSNWLSGVGGLLSAGISAWCFGADTVIKMANGSAKLIQDIKAGDKVVCPHADGSESVEMVTEVMEPHFADVYAVTVKYDGDKYHTVLTTSTQPLLCADGTFITVGNMKLNKELYGGYVIQSIEYDEFCEVYDLKVTGENNYYADGLVAKGGTIEW